MKKIVTPKEPCPKCGNDIWEGPRYKRNHAMPQQRDFREWLEFFCQECRYTIELACADAGKNHDA